MEYQIRKSKRARRLRISVSYDKGIVVTIPRNLGEGIVEKFLEQKKDWIKSKVEFFKSFEISSVGRYGKKDYLIKKAEALRFVSERISFIDRNGNFEFKRVSIKNQRTRWGSCSRKGNLNFNYKIIYLPSLLADYIIVHELCHLKEFNHSRNFWNLVSVILPDYLEARKELKRKTI